MLTQRIQECGRHRYLLWIPGSSECIPAYSGETNNVAELGAVLHLYTMIEEDIKAGKPIGIVTDSIYAIRCCTTYGKKCADKGWKEIPNKDMVKRAYELYRGTNVEFIHVMAHTGNTDVHSLGNREADRLATNAV